MPDEPKPEKIGEIHQPEDYQADNPHNRPCTACPFARNCPPGELGGSPPERYVGQSVGPFFIPCHARHDHKSLEARLQRDNPQCAGAAIFRANIDVATKLPAPLLRLPADTSRVFATHAEFVSHHRQIPLELAQMFLADCTPEFLKQHEMREAAARIAKGTAFFDLVPRK